ncbi:MAG: metal-dependent transcriptional regulator [Spirochaetales bacterium]
MENKNSLTQSLEDYLEAIYHLETKNRVARVKDIAEFLCVQMPSVTGAVKSLKKKKLVNYEKNSFISLTERGHTVAKAILRKHTVLQSFLEEVLLLPKNQAREIACKLEHSIDPEIALRLHNCTRYLTEEVFEKTLDPAEWRAKIIQSIS